MVIYLYLLVFVRVLVCIPNDVIRIVICDGKRDSESSGMKVRMSVVGADEGGPERLSVYTCNFDAERPYWCFHVD